MDKVDPVVCIYQIKYIAIQLERGGSVQCVYDGFNISDEYSLIRIV